jgi:hypothetical protein
MMPAPAMLRVASMRRWRRRAAVLAASLLCVPAAHAQDVTEASLKAAFIYNFAKFTEWPADGLPGTAPFNACVLGDAAIGDALERSVKGRLLSGHPISVLRVQIDGPLRTCHLLYVSGVSTMQITAIAAAVRGMPVLTIGDSDDFSRLGIAHIFVESGKMRFNLNLELAKRSRLQLSSKLLALAAHVHYGPGTAGR